MVWIKHSPSRYLDPVGYPWACDNEGGDGTSEHEA